MGFKPNNGVTVPRADLGALAYQFEITGSMRGFIADRILPIVEVGERTGDYPVISKETFLKLYDTKRNFLSEYKRSGAGFEFEDYTCKEYGWEEAIDDGERALYQRFFDAEEIATLRGVDQLLRSREKRVADMIFSETNFTKHDLEVEWSDITNSDPKKDVQVASEVIRKLVGMKPNVLVVNETVFINLLNNKKFVDACKYQLAAQVLPLDQQKALLSAYLGVEVLVPGGLYDTKAKGQDSVLADIWSSDYAFLGIVAAGRDLKVPSVGRTFLWTADSPQILTTEQYREEKVRADIYRFRHHLGEEFVSKECGYLFSNVTVTE